jgi:hypothetical protein
MTRAKRGPLPPARRAAQAAAGTLARLAVAAAADPLPPAQLLLPAKLLVGDDAIGGELARIAGGLRVGLNDVVLDKYRHRSTPGK